MRKPIVVEHSFGTPGSGGPITALELTLKSGLREKYDFVRMHQERAIGRPSVVLIRDWARMLREIRPDLVHVRGLGNEGFQGMLAARLARVPRILVSIHGTVRDVVDESRSWRRQTLVHGVEPATLRMATHIATVCRSASERTFLDPYRRKLVGELINGVPLVPRSAETRRSVRAALGVDPAAVVCVVVSRLSIDKGHLVLVKALDHIRHETPRKTLLVVGDGPDRSAIESAYRALPGVDLRMLGRRFDVADLLQASDIFLFPTLHENLSIALLEAMAAGLPIVATRVGGNVEVLERGGGELVRPSNAVELADAIGRLLSDRDLRSRHGAAARRVIEDGYTLAHMCDRLDYIYQSILDGGEPACVLSA